MKFQDFSLGAATLCSFAAKGHPTSLHRILNYFDPQQDKQDMFKILLNRGKSKGLFMGKYGNLSLSLGCLIVLCKYFRNDRKYLKRSLMKMSSTKQETAIWKIFQMTIHGSPTLERYGPGFLEDLPFNILKMIDLSSLIVESLLVS